MKQGEYKKGIWTPMVNNKEGHNQHTDKDKLKKVEQHRYTTLNESQYKEELKYLWGQKRYFQRLAQRYGTMVTFLNKCQKITSFADTIDKKADEDFEDMEAKR